MPLLTCTRLQWHVKAHITFAVEQARSIFHCKVFQLTTGSWRLNHTHCRWLRNSVNHLPSNCFQNALRLGENVSTFDWLISGFKRQMRISHVLPNKFHSTKLHVRQVHLAKKSERAGRRHCFLLCRFLTHEICSIMAVVVFKCQWGHRHPHPPLSGENVSTFDWLISGFKRQMRISHVLPNKFHSTKLHVRQVHLAKKSERAGRRQYSDPCLYRQKV